MFYLINFSFSPLQLILYLFNFLHFSNILFGLSDGENGRERGEKWEKSESKCLIRISLFLRDLCLPRPLRNIKLFVEKFVNEVCVNAFSLLFSPILVAKFFPFSLKSNENVYDSHGERRERKIKLSIFLQFRKYLSVLFHYSRVNRVLSSL